MRGNTDRPVDILGKDEFQIEPYVTGLAEFIEECDTPMTIAIQGDWGCGKTSVMNMTRNYLTQRNSIADVWFNTWQFSQFNMDGQLAITFLQHLINELSKRIENTDIKKKVFDKFTPIIKNITVGMTRQFIGADIGDVVDGIIAKNKLDIVDEICELKNNFQDLVMKVTNEGEKRVVVFIDDLDRLQPVRAVELLEILKLFVDCDNCVFVMAIDTSVVFQGIREKYGNDMSDEKAQSFFDKMIQMPFKMPVAYYQLNSMMGRLLSFLQEESLSQEEKAEYIVLFKKVTNGNPRSLKRLANSILLTEKVAEKKNIYANEPENMKLAIRRILVTLSCIQLQYESTYNFLVNDMTYKRIDTILALKIPDTDDSRRGEEIIDRLVDVGMPRPNVQDKLVFFDVITLYIKALMSYIACADKYKILRTTAIKQLMRVVTLSNISGNLTEETPGILSNAGGIVEKQEPVSQEIPLKFLYLGMCANGQYKEVYEQLTCRGLYLPLKWVERQNGGHRELEEFRQDLQPLEKCVLFGKIDEVLSQYSEKKIEKKYNGIVVTYAHEFKQDEYKRTEIVAKIRFEQEERALYLEGEATGEDMAPMEQTAVFADKLQKIYRSIQEEYSDKLVEDIDKFSKITVKNTQDGGVTKLSFSGFPIMNEEMADAIVEYFTFAFKNIATYYQKAPTSNAMDILLCAAKSADSEYK